MEARLKQAEKVEEPKKEKKFKLPMKWNSKISRANKKVAKDKILVMYLNAKGEIGDLMFVPLLAGNLLIYNNRVHEFDPSDFWIWNVNNKTVKVLIVKESDRKPVSNKDWNEIKARGDSTRNDEILLKMIKIAMLEKVKKQVSSTLWWVIGGIVALVIIGYVVFA